DLPGKAGLAARLAAAPTLRPMGRVARDRSADRSPDDGAVPPRPGRPAADGPPPTVSLQISWSMGLRRPARGGSGCRASRFACRPTGLDPDALVGFPPPARVLRGTALLIHEFGPVPVGRPPAEGAEPRHDVRTFRRPDVAELGLHPGRS